MKTQISPKELSRAVGVSESSLKRWVDDGQLTATRTAGGHRRIRIDEAVRFIRDTGLHVVEPEVIGLGDVKGALDASASEAGHGAFARALQEGNGPKTRDILVHGYMTGHGVADLCDHLIAPAMHEIGELWRHDAKGVFIEHRATCLCAEALHHLRSLFTRAGDKAPLALGGAPSNDIYALPTLMAGVALAGEGWREMNLGPDTPNDSLLLAARTLRPRLVWLSISVSQPDEVMRQQINNLAQKLEPLSAKLIVGGRAAPGRRTGLHANVHVASSMAELASFAAGLRQAGGSPRRKA